MIRIRKLEPHRDAGRIAEIYAWYVNNSTATFETVPPSPETMEERLQSIEASFPAFVCEEIDCSSEINSSDGAEGPNMDVGIAPDCSCGNEATLIGYCYAHLWKTFAAYSLTLETTIYLRPGELGRGIGKALMDRLIEACRQRGYRSLIACITAENEGSRRFHERLGFTQVSDFRDVGHKFGRLLSVTDYQLPL